MNQRNPIVGTLSIVGWSLLVVFIAACNSQPTRNSAAPTSSSTAAKLPIPEHLRLDVGVNVFDPGIAHLDEDAETSTPGIRRAEAYYFADQIKLSLNRTGQWGAVRLIPQRQSEMDLWVEGEIIESNGLSLEIRVTLENSAGRKVYTRTYADEVNKYAYDRVARAEREPFQAVYDRIAADIDNYVRRLSHADLANLRNISALKVAQRFAPEAFGDYLSTDDRGNIAVNRLPAENDPLMLRVKRIRVRDQKFVDVLQDHYDGYLDKMITPYDQWRLLSYRETKALKKIESQALTRKIGGALAILAGILAQGSDSSAVRGIGVAGVVGGAVAVSSGFQKSAEGEIHSAALRELAYSLDAEIEPHTIQLTDRAVTLSGTVDQQYQQWRALLREIYLTETGAENTETYSD